MKITKVYKLLREVDQHLYGTYITREAAVKDAKLLKDVSDIDTTIVEEPFDLTIS